MWMSFSVGVRVAAESVALSPRARDVNCRPNSCKSSPPVSAGVVSVEMSVEVLA